MFNNLLIISLIIFSNLLILYFFENISNYVDINDKPNSRKIHKYPIPLLGGGIFIISFLVLYLINLDFFFKNFSFNPHIFFCFCVLFFLFGLFDDKFNLNPLFKTFLQILLLFIFLEVSENQIIDKIRISFTENIFLIDGKHYSIFFTLLCIFLYQNAINMFDGINLQLGLYVATCVIIINFFLKDTLFLIFLIPLFIFLYLNFKNKCFFGNSGAYFIAFFLGIIFIDCYNNDKILFSDYIFIFMSLPGIDMARLFIIRIANKKNPFKADKKHIHHILLEKVSYNKAILYSYLNFLIPVFILLLTKNSIISFLVFLIFYIFNTTNINKKIF